MMRKLIYILLVSALFSCTKDDMVPDCEQLKTGSVQVVNKTGERCEISVSFVSAKIGSGDHLLVQDISAGDHAVNVTCEEGSEAVIYVCVTPCEVSEIEIK